MLKRQMRCETKYKSFKYNERDNDEHSFTKPLGSSTSSGVCSGVDLAGS